MSPLTEVSYHYDNGSDLAMYFGDFRCAIDLSEGDTPRDVVSKLRRAALVIEEEAKEGVLW